MRSWLLRHGTSVVCPGLVMYDLQMKASKLNQKHALRVCFMSILYITHIPTHRFLGYAVNRSKFEVRVHGAAQKLRKSLLGYLSTANGLEGEMTLAFPCISTLTELDPESEMTLVLSPVTSNRQIERTSMSGEF